MEWVIGAILLAILALQAKQTFAQSTPPERFKIPVTAPPDLPFNALFDKYASAYSIPKRLLVSIVAHESNFNPKAVNRETEADRRKGRDVDSLGLAQILFPDTAQSLRPNIQREALFDPDTNLSLAAQLLQRLLRTWKATETDGFPSHAVAAYNAGSARFKADGSFVNQEYVDKVRSHWRKYSNIGG